MQTGDVVCVVQQPANLLPQIVGDVGYVEQVKGDYAQIQTLHLDGSLAGTGSVPIACLAPENRQEWVQAKTLHDAEKRRLRKEGQTFSDRVNAKRAELADRYGITVDAVSTILQEIHELYP